jgi:hypothetical protein
MMLITKTLFVMFGMFGVSFGRNLRGNRHRLEYSFINSPAPTPSPGLKEWVLPAYDPVEETQELVPPSPLPSPVPVPITLVPPTPTLAFTRTQDQNDVYIPKKGSLIDLMDSSKLMNSIIPKNGIVHTGYYSLGSPLMIVPVEPPLPLLPAPTKEEEHYMNSPKIKNPKWEFKQII